jgi:predicted PurR-regulated permease PerM
VVFVLHAARPVLIPLALAALGTFVLAPVVTLVERTGLRRVPAALITLALAAAVLVGVGWLVVSQVTAFAEELPAHRELIKRKIDHLRAAGGPIPEALDVVRDVTGGAEPAGDAGRTAPVVRVEDSSPFTRAAESVATVVQPLAAAALVAVLLAFMLIGREGLRDRVLGVVGKGQLLGATRVLTESAEKVSRFLLFQLAVNAGFGALLAAGLLVIGVPYAPLWGFLSGLLRFVPYVGTWVSVLFPLAVSFATSAGWGQPAAVFAYFLVLEVVVANVVEPLLFGHHTGVSPIALLVSAAFWTWLWGPLGLVLSTPITVCLVVMGQHVPRLRHLALLLGAGTALPPAVRYYQRLLAGDRAGAAGVVAGVGGADDSPAGAYDAVVVPALAMACRDRAGGGLSAEEEEAVFAGTAALLDSKPAEAGPQADAPHPVLPGAGGVVVGAPAHRAAEGLPLRMMANVLAADGCRVEVATTHLLPAQVEQMVADRAARAVVVSVIPPGGVVQAVHLCRRLRERFPELPIVVAYHGSPARYDRLLVRMREAGASHVTTSVAQACGQLRAILSAGAGPGPRRGRRKRG